MQLTIRLLAVCALAAGCLSIQADTTLRYVDAGSGAAAASVQVRAGMVRIDRPADGFTAIIDAVTGVVTLVDLGRREYRVIDRETRSAMQMQMQTMRKQMEAQLAALPAEQRATIEQQMQGMLGTAGEAPAMQMRATGSKRRVGGYDCTDWEGSVGGRRVSGACVAEASTVGVAADDTATLKAMATALMEFAGSMAGAAGTPPSAASDGVPVETSDAATGRIEVLADVSDEPLPGELFEVPAGFDKVQMMPHGG